MYLLIFFAILLSVSAIIFALMILRLIAVKIIMIAILCCDLIGKNKRESETSVLYVYYIKHNTRIEFKLC